MAFDKHISFPQLLAHKANNLSNWEFTKFFRINVTTTKHTLNTLDNFIVTNTIEKEHQKLKLWRHKLVKQTGEKDFYVSDRVARYFGLVQNCL